MITEDGGIQASSTGLQDELEKRTSPPILDNAQDILEIPCAEHSEGPENWDSLFTNSSMLFSFLSKNIPSASELTFLFKTPTSSIVSGFSSSMKSSSEV
ncbi:hypothetical protein Ahy_A02g009410 isoform G [Arachis hypogaea]|uniref:Uncharacterized protein n=1 Tax=Arachis hypogaea TaxID=3818 RepID=A0A445EGX7_ARAHY|nr:hypothetical protein Ahy_A02g009410 isoform G [Arachis hypogaea]